MKRSLPTFVTAILFCSFACQKGTPQPPIDQSTPDKLVESLWKYNEWEVAKRNHDYLRQPHPDYAAFSSEAQAKFRSNDTEAVSVAKYLSKNKIANVKIESPTRAIVTSNEYLWSEDEVPKEITYLLTSLNGAWIIKDRTRICEMCKGNGKGDDLEKKLADIKAGHFDTHPIADCKFCLGKGWYSMIFGK